MGKTKIESVQDRFVDAFMTARRWWEEDAGQLPGEAGRNTVFVIDFADGCRYCGYTSWGVFDRVSALVMKRGAYKTNPFVSDHAVRVPYVVRCVASGLDRSDARQLRDVLVSLGPSRSAGAGRSVVESACCWLADDVVGDSLPFSEVGSFNLDVLLGSRLEHDLP